jgi:hypothetical protein
LVDKLDGYDLAGVPLYVIVDITHRRGQTILRLLGYRQTPTVYEPLAPNEQGRLWLEPVRLWLGIQGTQVLCYDEAGNVIGDYLQVDAARIAAESRAEAVEARLRELEAELRQMREGS